jgi:hypothetical protein
LRNKKLHNNKKAVPSSGGFFLFDLWFAMMRDFVDGSQADAQLAGDLVVLAFLPQGFDPGAGNE